MKDDTAAKRQELHAMEKRLWLKEKELLLAEVANLRARLAKDEDRPLQIVRDQNEDGYDCF